MDELKSLTNEDSEDLFSESEKENDSLPLRRIYTTYDTYAKALSNARKKETAAKVQYVLQTSDSSDADGEDSASPSPSLKRLKSTLSASVSTKEPARRPRGDTNKKSTTPIQRSAVFTKERHSLSEPSKRRDCRGKENDMTTTSGTKFSSNTARKVILGQKSNNSQLQHLTEGGSDSSGMDLASISPSSSSTPCRPRADHGNMGVDMAQELKKTNQLIGELLQQFQKTERRVQAIEEKLNTTTSSSSSGSVARKKKRQKEIPNDIKVTLFTLYSYVHMVVLQQSLFYYSTKGYM